MISDQSMPLGYSALPAMAAGHHAVGFNSGLGAPQHLHGTRLRVLVYNELTAPGPATIVMSLRSAASQAALTTSDARIHFASGPFALGVGQPIEPGVVLLDISLDLVDALQYLGLVATVAGATINAGGCVLGLVHLD